MQAFECLQLEAPALPELVPDGFLLLHKRRHGPSVCNQAADHQHAHLPLVRGVLPVPRTCPCWPVVVKNKESSMPSGVITGASAPVMECTMVCMARCCATFEQFMVSDA